MGKKDHDDEDTPRLPLPGEYRIVRRRRVTTHSSDENPDRGNGTGKTDLNKVKDEEIARLRSLLDERDRDLFPHKTIQHWKNLLTAASCVVGLCSALFAGLAWYTSTALNTAMVAERAATKDQIDTALRMQLASARFASAETVAVQQQKLADIDRRLTEMNQKLDTLLLRTRAR